MQIFSLIKTQTCIISNEGVSKKAAPLKLGIARNSEKNVGFYYNCSKMGGGDRKHCLEDIIARIARTNRRVSSVLN